MSAAKTILTVDDSRTMRDLLMLTLTAGGYEVEQAEDGVAGLEKLQGMLPDAIITDINMPRLDGFGFIEEVRKDPSRRTVPILVLTTESEGELKERARKAGASGWIVKPYSPTTLLSALRRVGV
jgi:two-component system chemotaxis response regulator CheY